jgi:magnesium transporter
MTANPELLHLLSGEPSEFAEVVAGMLVGVITFGSLTGSMLPFTLKRLGLDPASTSATLVDVTGIVIYFTLSAVVLRGTVL